MEATSVATGQLRRRKGALPFTDVAAGVEVLRPAQAEAVASRADCAITLDAVLFPFQQQRLLGALVRQRLERAEAAIAERINRIEH
jgi:hypothetical protein